MDRHTEFVDPGPIDTSVLHMQPHHRSTAIWEGRDLRRLHCRRVEASIRRVIQSLDDRVLRYLLRAGFYGIYRLGFMALDWSLITALVERWRVETHTFHLPVGEATITLQDVAVLLGLPVDGDVVTGRDTHRTVPEWQQMCQELLGITPPPSAFDASRLRLTTLTDRLSQPLPPDADDHAIQAYARTYMLLQLGDCLFADKSQNKVKLLFMPLIRDLIEAGRLSWGSAALACLYRELCLATRADAAEIGGPLILLQLWAWERILHIRPQRRDIHPRGAPPPVEAALPKGPLGCRWDVRHSKKDTPTNVLRHYRDQLDQMREEQMMWEPYTIDVINSLPQYCCIRQDIWLARVPLIYFAVFEWHFLDQVLRQFGIRQTIPIAFDTSRQLHAVDRRGRPGHDWADRHRVYIELWGQRCEHVVTGDPGVRLMQDADSYMCWYRSITRRFIGPPIARPPVGFQPVASIREILEDTMGRIWQLAHAAARETTDAGSSHSVAAYRQIEDMAAVSLRAAHEEQRIVEEEVHQPPSDAEQDDMAQPRHSHSHPMDQPPHTFRAEPFYPPRSAIDVSTSSPQSYSGRVTPAWSSPMHTIPLSIREPSLSTSSSHSPVHSPIHLRGEHIVSSAPRVEPDTSIVEHPTETDLVEPSESAVVPDAHIQETHDHGHERQHVLEGSKVLTQVDPLPLVYMTRRGRTHKGRGKGREGTQIEQSQLT